MSQHHERRKCGDMAHLMDPMFTESIRTLNSSKLALESEVSYPETPEERTRFVDQEFIFTPVKGYQVDRGLTEPYRGRVERINTTGGMELPQNAAPYHHGGPALNLGGVGKEWLLVVGINDMGNGIPSRTVYGRIEFPGLK